MPESSGDENDSRTASFGQQRNRVNSANSSGSSRPSSSQHPNKRQKRASQTPADSGDARDFVPQGATFSATSLEVDPDSTSSSGSSNEHEGEGEGEGDDNDDNVNPSQVAAASNPHAGSTAPAINWNQGSRRAIRTTLGGRRNANANDNNKKPEPQESKSDAQFEAVNGAFWRSRSDSASTGDGKQKDGDRDQDQDMEEGEVHDENRTAEAGSSRMDSSGDSDDSESLDSRADDSIMLNIGGRPAEKQNGQAATNEEEDDYDPEFNPALDESLANGSASGVRNGTTTDSSKEEAMRSVTQTYPTAPAVMVDLVGDDMDIQARYMYWRGMIDHQSPVCCTECLQEGHIAQVCPSKECLHCGAWNKHDSNFCPSWRRCQRCRERGHDESQCSSLLKSSPSEVPCDLCGSSDHLELECDHIWKLPLRDPSSGPVLVSISCSHCTSSHHLVGDCPSLRRALASSSWTLRGIDPQMVTNTNNVMPSRRGAGPVTRSQRGMKIRGRADHRSPTPDSDEDMLSRPDRRPSVGRPSGRGNIRIGGGIGRGKNLGPNYRDRGDSFGDRSRQRSLSPNGRPGRGRGRDSWNGRSRSPSRGRGRPLLPPPRGGRGRGGGKRGGGSGDAYRPLPSAGKKAWDRYRL